MAKFNFSVSKTAKPKASIAQKKTKTVLNKHENITYIGELYTYIDDNGEERKYSGIITKQDDGQAFGKIQDVHYVDLEFHPEIEHVDPIDEHFTYLDSDGNEHIYKGKVEYDLERSTYIGVLRNRKINEHMIQIFEEK